MHFVNEPMNARTRFYTRTPFYTYTHIYITNLPKNAWDFIKNIFEIKDRVALVTAAPPSYTRMYHYFPAHLTAHPFCFYPQPPPPPPLAPPGMTQLPAPPTLKHLGNSLSSMTQAHIAQTLRYPGKNPKIQTLNMQDFASFSNQ